MTIVGFSFRLSDLETGRSVAHAVLCPEAGYASVLAAGATRLDRQLVTPFQWLLLGEQLRGRVNAGPLARASAIVAFLLGADDRSSIVVQHLVSTPFDAAPEDAAATLDTHLLEVAAMSPYPIRLSRLN